MNNLIITGARGFVGQNLVPYLAKSHSVYTVSREAQQGNSCTWDTLTTLPQKAKAFIHLAGKAHDVKGEALAQEYVDVNVGLTKKAFEAFQKSEAEVFVYFSSVKAVASTVSGVLTENDAFEVDNPYGASKRAAEAYLLAQPLQPNQRLYILRPCMIHGPGNKGNLNLLYQMAKRGVPFPFGAFENERSLLGIANLNAVVDALIQQQPDSGVFNLSDDGYISTTGIYEAMGNVLRKKPMVLKVPKSLIKFLGRIGDHTPLPIDSLKILKLTENYRVSNAKIKGALGWDSMPHSLSENLKNTLKSFNS